MFVTKTTVARKGSTELLAHLALSSSLRIVAVSRRGLRYNSAYAPASSAEPTGWVALHVVLDGTFAAGLERSAGRAAWVYSEDDFEGCRSGRRHNFQTFGEPFWSVTVLAHETQCALTLPPDGTPRQLVTPASIFVACERYLEAVERRMPSSESAAATRALCDVFKLAGWLASDLDPVVQPIGHARISAAIGQIIGRFDPSAQLAELAERMETTPRRADRVLRVWLAAHGLPDESWRVVTRRWRLKMAVLMCSSRDYSVTEVAKLVGYTSTNSMTNAFAAAQLPPPSWFRSPDLLAGGSA